MQNLMFWCTLTLDAMLDIDMFMKLAPASVATAFASIVFPVPGGPKSKIPLQGCKYIKVSNYEIAYSNPRESLDKISLQLQSTSKQQFSLIARPDSITTTTTNQILTFVSCPLQNSSGLCRGSMTSSFNVSFTDSKAPMSSNVTPISLGGITSPSRRFSNSLSVTTS